MVTELSENDFLSALEYLAALEGLDVLGEPLRLVFPYGVFPGQTPGGTVKLNNQKNWDAYQWNPPQFSKHTESQEWTWDNPVSPKPTWKMLVDAAGIAGRQKADIRKKTMLREYKTWTRAQISAQVFKASDIEDEILDRAHGKFTPAQEDQADEVKKVYRVHKEAVKKHTITDEKFMAALADGYQAITAEIEKQLTPPLES